MELLTTSQLKDFFLAGIENLNKYAAELNELNVFPVPDQDTGTNLVLTLEETKNKLSSLKKFNSRKFVQILSETSTVNARGNSGIILSQFLTGFSSKIKDSNKLRLFDLTEAFKAGRDYAYSSIANPTEGTILTVINCASQKLEENEGKQLLSALEAATKKAYQSLLETPNLLPVLKQAGVVDSAAAGFVLLLDGGISKLNGKKGVVSTKMKKILMEKPRTKPTKSAEAAGFCINIKLTGSILPLHRIRTILGNRGDSLIVGGSKELTTIHIHAKEAEDLKKLIGKFGKISKFQQEPLNKVKTEPNPLIDLSRYYEKG